MLARPQLWIVCMMAVMPGVGCKYRPGGSDVKVVQGDAAARHDPAIVLLGVDVDKDQVCTGVAVSASTVLMAGHCVKDPTLEKGVSYFDRQRDVTFKSTRLYTWMALKNRDKLSEALAARDIAVVYFEDRPFSNFKSISRQAPVAGQRIDLVGYGVTDFGGTNASPDGQPRQSRGTNSVAGISANNEGLIWIEATNDRTKPDNAIAGPGDSGGPVLNAAGEILGLAAGIYFVTDSKQKPDAARITTSPTGWQRAVNTYASLSSPSAVALLQFAVNDLADIPGFSKGRSSLFDRNDVSFMSERPDLGAAGAEKTKEKFLALCGSGGGGGGYNDGGQPGGNNRGNSGENDGGNFDNYNRDNFGGRGDQGRTPDDSSNQGSRSDQAGQAERERDRNGGQNGSPVSFQSKCASCHNGTEASRSPSRATWQQWVSAGATTVAQMRSVFESLTPAQRQQITGTMP